MKHACLLALLLAQVLAGFGHAGDFSNRFDQANQLYEQGKFTDAVTAYETLLPDAAGSVAVWFNLGNANFKAGQTGRAIAAWLRAEQLAPRDPAVRFNLAFARKRVSGSDQPPGPFWKRALRNLTLNEWSILAACAVWVWFGLLALREFRLNLRRVLSGYTATAGILTVIVVACLASAALTQWNQRRAVVVTPDAVVRSGPLDEARVMHQFRDGTEVTVLDEKAVATAGRTVKWIQIRDGTGRAGWVKGTQLVVVQ